MSDIVTKEVSITLQYTLQVLKMNWLSPQVFPVHPGSQVHVYPLTLSVHVPCWHGLDSHSSISVHIARHVCHHKRYEQQSWSTSILQKIAVNTNAKPYSSYTGKDTRVATRTGSTSILHYCAACSLFCCRGKSLQNDKRRNAVSTRCAATLSSNFSFVWNDSYDTAVQQH